MKVCFEGPSGIGKTTLARMFSDEYKVIPEVNVLFKDEENLGGLWYYRKQVERYRISEGFENTIFDGDIFQPLWYNWSYKFPDGYLSVKEMKAFYHSEIVYGSVAFPDLYIIFHASIDKLKERKENDKTRRRSNFEKHLQLLKTQPLYFGHLKNEFPHLVEFVEYDSTANAVVTVRSIIEKRITNVNYDSMDILNTITEWLMKN